jgi:AcrR family transcriptional regulator
MQSHRNGWVGLDAIRSHWLREEGRVPKQVDHQDRRREIAAAVCRLAARSGLESVSLRHVAAEAGVSMGRVQHYFTTKDEMLLFAFNTLGEHIEQRIAAAVAAVESPGPRSVLRALLVELMPISAEARAEGPVWAAFLARAVVEPALAEPIREGAPRMVGFVAEHIRAAQRRGEVVAEVDAEREAEGLLAVVDGLMLHLLVGQVEVDTALSTLDYQLDRVFR